MRHLLGLVLCASAAWAAPSKILPRYLPWICHSDECPIYWFQGTDSCYFYCVAGTCDVRGQDCKVGCTTYCNNHCDDIAADQLTRKRPEPICKTGPLPEVYIQKAPPNESGEGQMHLLPGTQSLPDYLPKPYDPVTNPSSFLPGSEQELGVSGDSVALVPLPDENTPTDPAGTVDLGATLPSLDRIGDLGATLPSFDINNLQQMHVDDEAAAALGIVGYTGNAEPVPFSFGDTSESQLAFTNSDPLGGDTFSTTNNQDPGLVGLGTTLADFSNPDGDNFVASNNFGVGYEDFLS